jgi:hypothetical protein
MTYFYEQNTEGFSAADLDAANAAAAFLVSQDFDVKCAVDAVNNAWQEGLTAAEIVQRVEAFGMF